jgi:hypothetical protein
MRTTKAAFCLLCLSGGLFAEAPKGHADPRAVEWLRKIDDMWRGDSSQAKMTMHVKSSHYERTLKLEAWSKGQDYSLVRILEPKKERGSSTLKAKESLYSYLPRTDRTIKLSSGMMGSSWMGSHFTNDDLVQQSRLSRDYDPYLVFEGMRDGVEVVELDLRPKPDAAVVWGRIETVIRKDTLMPQKSVYYDEELKEARRMEFSEVRDFGDRKAPARLLLHPSGAPGEYTEMRYESLDFGVGLQSSFFSLSRLKEP